MEQRNIILKNWEKEIKIFSDNLAICRKRSTKKSVHDLRVAVKKMRSYLRLKKKFNRDKWKEHFLTTADLFKSFGQQRDFEMSINLTRRYEAKKHFILTEFRKFLSGNRTLARRLAKETAIKYNEQELATFNHQFATLNNLSETQIIEKIIHFSKKKIEKVKKLAKEFYKNAHEIRKQLKDIFYWLMLCPADLAKDVINLKELEAMLGYLGKWQDHFILRRKINLFAKHSLTEEESLKHFKKLLITSQRKLLHKAKKKWMEMTNKKSD